MTTLLVLAIIGGYCYVAARVWPRMLVDRITAHWREYKYVEPDAFLTGFPAFFMAACWPFTYTLFFPLMRATRRAVDDANQKHRDEVILRVAEDNLRAERRARGEAS